MSEITELQRYNVYANDRHVFDVVIPTSEIATTIDYYWEATMESVAEEMARGMGFSDPVVVLDEIWMGSLQSNLSSGGIDAMVLSPVGTSSDHTRSIEALTH